MTLITEHWEVFNKVAIEIMYNAKNFIKANNFKYKEGEEYNTHELFLKVLFDDKTHPNQ